MQQSAEGLQQAQGPVRLSGHGLMLCSYVLLVLRAGAGSDFPALPDGGTGLVWWYLVWHLGRFVALRTMNLLEHVGDV